MACDYEDDALLLAKTAKLIFKEIARYKGFHFNEGATKVPAEFELAYMKLREQVEKVLRHSAYSVVDLGQLFNPLYKLDTTPTLIDTHYNNQDNLEKILKRLKYFVLSRAVVDLTAITSWSSLFFIADLSTHNSRCHTHKSFVSLILCSVQQLQQASKMEIHKVCSSCFGENPTTLCVVVVKPLVLLGRYVEGHLEGCHVIQSSNVRQSIIPWPRVGTIGLLGVESTIVGTRAVILVVPGHSEPATPPLLLLMRQSKIS
uniref:Uncharacterized protein n=1 Tax=Timema monikensis TaxID=170555 RepID=A0A7R9HJI9_9NEOP|nr:unnamed protein product [Timema monikensis]